MRPDQGRARAACARAGKILRQANRSELWFRVLLSQIFIVAGLQHLLATERVAERLQNTGAFITTFLPPHELVLLAGAGLFSGGVALLIGYRTHWAALLLLALLLPITLVVQVDGLDSIGPLFKNISLSGGLVYFAADGGKIRPPKQMSRLTIAKMCKKP